MILSQPANGRVVLPVEPLDDWDVLLIPKTPHHPLIAKENRYHKEAANH